MKISALIDYFVKYIAIHGDVEVDVSLGGEEKKMAPPKTKKKEKKDEENPLDVLEEYIKRCEEEEKKNPQPKQPDIPSPWDKKPWAPPHDPWKDCPSVPQPKPWKKDERWPWKKPDVYWCGDTINEIKSEKMVRENHMRLIIESGKLNIH